MYALSQQDLVKKYNEIILYYSLHYWFLSLPMFTYTNYQNPLVTGRMKKRELTNEPPKPSIITNINTISLLYILTNSHSRWLI